MAARFKGTVLVGNDPRRDADHRHGRRGAAYAPTGTGAVVSVDATQTLTNKTITLTHDFESDAQWDDQWLTMPSAVRPPFRRQWFRRPEVRRSPTRQSWCVNTLSNVPFSALAAFDVQTFTANGTWTKPTIAHVVQVVELADGGGGRRTKVGGQCRRWRWRRWRRLC